MKEVRSSRWHCSVPLVIVSMLGLTLLVVTVVEVFAHHALGTEAQLDWRLHLLKVDEALARNDLAGAAALWREAYAAALKSRHWEGMVATADAYRRLGERAGLRKASEAKAREAYLAALFRARSEGSIEGVLRTAERFAELGDHAVVEQCIHVARSVAARARDPRAAERVRAFTERWAASAAEMGPDTLP